MIWGWDPSPKTILESDEGEDRLQPFVWKSWALSPIAPGSQTRFGMESRSTIWTVPGSKIYPTVNRLKKNDEKCKASSVDVKKAQRKYVQGKFQVPGKETVAGRPFQGPFLGGSKSAQRVGCGTSCEQFSFFRRFRLCVLPVLVGWSKCWILISLNIDSLVFSNCPGFWSQRQYLLVRVKYFVLMSSEFQLGLETFRKLFLRPCSE